MNGDSRRRSVLAALTATAASVVAPLAFAADAVRLGILPFGTVQWVVEVIRRQGLDARYGVALETVTLANNDAGRVALMAGGADIVVSDWLFAAQQRHAGTKLCFAPFSSATGGVMVPQDSAIHGLGDLRNKRIGVAGGPLDKSWILVQAAARSKAGLDLAGDASPNFGAPPLLEAKLRQGQLDADLTFWNFCARLEADGYRQAFAVTDCARELGIAGPLDLVGYVFHQDWAERHRATVDGFLAASAAAETALAQDDAAWKNVRPLMQAPGEALFAALRRRFVAGIVHAPLAERVASATQLLGVLQRIGDGRAADGLTALPAGLFWREAHA